MKPCRILKSCFREPRALLNHSMLYPSLLFILPRESPSVIFKYVKVLNPGLWGWVVQSWLGGKIFWTMAGYAHCFLQLKIANRFLHTDSSGGRLVWKEAQTSFSHFNSNILFLATIILTSRGASVEPCDSAISAAFQLSPRTDKSPRSMGSKQWLKMLAFLGCRPHALPSKINISLWLYTMPGSLD